MLHPGRPRHRQAARRCVLQPVRDCLELFEEFGWDWSCRAFRGWNSWSVENGPNNADTAPNQAQTGREKLRSDWVEKNLKAK